MITAVNPSGTTMATQKNAWATPEFAYFSDTYRDLIKGNGGYGGGYIQNTSELKDPEGTFMECFTANTFWIQNPTQVINYASCHDNYTLMDKINLTNQGASLADRAKMNNLAAAMYITSEGIPLIHAGEEILRVKVDRNGEVIHNSYNSPDYINSIKWGELDSAQYQQVRDYYKGLIEFRKNHAALRLTTKDAVNANVESIWVDENVVMFKIRGKDYVSTEVADEIVVIYNPTKSTKTFSIYDKGASTGTWNICVNDTKAGTDVLGTVTNGQVSVPAVSAMILVKGKTVDENSVYNQQSSTPIGTVEVSYVDENGKTIAQSETLKGEVGSSYTTQGKAVDGYVLQTQPSNAKGVFANGKITVKYVYASNPTKVTGFTYSAATYNSITLKWTKNTSAQGYIIEQYKGSKWTVIKTITSNSTLSHKVTSLEPNTAYKFRIKSYKTVGSTKIYSDVSTATIKTASLIDLSKATVTIGQSSFGYTGEYIKPVVTVKVVVDGKTVTLTNWTDYKVTYSNFKNPGTATITVTGRGQYTGSKSINFTIRPVDLSKATVTIGQPSFGYTGEYIKPVVTVKVVINGKTVTLTNWKDYKVEYKNFKNPGVATITVVARGITSGSKSITFQIRPAQVKKLTFSVKTSDYITLMWDKCVGVTGYEVYRATSKNGTYTKVGTVTTNTYKNSGLKRKTTYYYKVRAYKTVGSTKIYGNYSTVYAVATK